VGVHRALGVLEGPGEVTGCGETYRHGMLSQGESMLRQLLLQDGGFPCFSAKVGMGRGGGNMTGWREVGSKLGQYSVAQVSGLIDKAAGTGIIGYCMFWEKQWGMDVLKKTMGSGCSMWPS